MNDVRDLLEQLANVAPVASAVDVLERAERRAGTLRRRRARRRTAAVGAIAAAALVVAVVVAANGPGGRRGVDVNRNPTTPLPVTTRYQIVATVLQAPTHGPQLCIGVVHTKPPVCAGPAIAGWNWAKVSGEQASTGNTWGTYHVVGTYDGTTFHVTQTPTVALDRAPPDPSQNATPCPTPPGGWTVVDQGRVTNADLNALAKAAQNKPDSAGFWEDSLAPVRDRTRFNVEVATVAFTGHLAEHRAQLRAVWGGPICVVQRPRTLAELHRAFTALMGDEGRRLGLQAATGTDDPVHDRIEIDVPVATPALQATIDHEYGAGAVYLHGELTPIP